MSRNVGSVKNKELRIRVLDDGEGHVVVSDADTGEELTNIRDLTIFYDPDSSSFVASLEVLYPILDVMAVVEDLTVKDEE